MGLILEDGTGPAGANSYATEDMADTYFEDRANTTWTDSTDDKEAALIRASAAIDGIYRARFSGYRTFLREQGLEWPRISAYDAQGNLIAADEIPVEIIKATCEAAYRELTDPGTMMPDLERGGGIKLIKAGSVTVEYGAGSDPYTTRTLIDGILSGLLGVTSQYAAQTVRG